LRSVLLALALLVAPAAKAQSLRTHDPAGRWRTVQTEHFRLYYPDIAKGWALYAAARLESMHARVEQAVGYQPPEVTDIVVMDPLRMSNGFALPFTWGPRMGIFATPPDATPFFGHYRSWTEELITHEDTHLVHLLRPSRNPLMALLSKAAGGTTPMTTNSPPWVTEGYATVIEGRLTGMGRPNSDFRALMIRRLAEEGRLPTFAELSDSSRWMGGAFRYEVGSAFLEWLEARTHPGALQDLWARMTARAVRSFDDAFEGVFGDDPATLYGRFRAEVTADAMHLDKERPTDQGTLWLDLSRSTGAPAVSPDGASLAVVLRHEVGPPSIAVYETKDDPDAEKQWEQDVQGTLAKDPEDVAPVKPEVFPRTPIARRVRNARPPGDPRWTPDGKALLFPAWRAAGDGFLRPDLYRWEPATGKETRVTHGADIVDVDPSPDGTRAVCVRTAWGSQQLIEVDLATGAWTGLTDAAPDRMYDDPRSSPDGNRLAYLEHVEGGWKLMVRELATGKDTEVALPPHSDVSGPAWAPDGSSILASLGTDGFIEVYRIPLDGGAPVMLTHSRGGAAAVAPTPDGKAIFYLSMDAEGLDVHRLALADALPAGTLPADGVAPVVRPAPPPPVPPAEPAEVTPHRYGPGRWEPSPIVGLAVAPESATVALGMRFGDVVGRNDLLILGSHGNRGGWRGLSIAYAFRGWPITVTGQTFAIAQHGAHDVQRAGGALTLGWERHVGPSVFSVTAGGLGDVPWGGDAGPSRAFGFLGGGARPRWGHGLLKATGDLGARARAGWTGGQGTWVAGEARAAGSIGVGTVAVGAGVGGGRTGSTAEVDRYRLGGTDTAMVPRAWLWSRVLDPPIRLTPDTGEAFTTQRAWLDIAGMQLGVERHHLYPHCDQGTCAAPLEAIVASARFEGEIPATGLTRTPAVHGWAGVACSIKDPELPMPDKPCTHLDDWRGWLGLTWRP